MIRTLHLLAFTGALLLLMTVYAAAGWIRPAQPELVSTSIEDIAAHPSEPGQIILASGTEVLSGNYRGPWTSLGRLPSGTRIEKIEVFSELPSSLFLLTDKGLFQGNLRARLETRTESRSKHFFALAILPEDPAHWFAGTSEGLLESDDGGNSWFPFSGFPGRGPVRVLRFYQGTLYAGSDGTLWASENLRSFRRLFSIPPVHGEVPEMTDGSLFENEEDPAASASAARLYELCIDEAFGRFWLATTEGVYESADFGAGWQRLPLTGLAGASVMHLVYASKSGQLLAGTSAGVYAYNFSERRWREFFKGLAYRRPAALALTGGETETLVAATDSGLAYHPIEIHLPQIPEPSGPPFERLALFRELVRFEPGAREVQQAVIRYANVGRGKTQRWHWQSRLSSLLPSLSWGRDYSEGQNIDLDRGSTSEPDVYITGPEDTNLGWDVGVSWNLSDLIWSSSQTSIDSREKLTVELRNDLVAEATRIYYERRRLQMEIVFSPQADARHHLEQLSRLDELTSLLDGLTGGEFGEKLSGLYRRYPELEGLWHFEGFQDIKPSGELSSR